MYWKGGIRDRIIESEVLNVPKYSSGERHQLSIHNAPHLLRHPVGWPHPPGVRVHLCLSPGPAVVVQHHHAGALGKCLHDAHVRGVGTSRDIEEEEAREEEEDGKVLELQKVLSFIVES